MQLRIRLTSSLAISYQSKRGAWIEKYLRKIEIIEKEKVTCRVDETLNELQVYDKTKLKKWRKIRSTPKKEIIKLRKIV